jgi:hypothetical protein
MSNGIQVTQRGIPVDRASDYQKVLDSRWRFMEVALDIDTTIHVPAMATPTYNTYQRVNIAKHNLTNQGRPFVPAFHGSWLPDPSYPLYDGFNQFDIYPGAGLFMDDQYIYFQRLSYSTGVPLVALTIKVKAKIYNLDILSEYLAIQEIPRGSGKTNTQYGITALDGSNSSATVGGTSPDGYSIDTRKKVLSIHKVAQKDIYAFPPESAHVTALNTSTDIATVTTDPNEIEDLYGTKHGISWIQTGVQVSLSPNDFVTYPSPLSFSVQPYIIKVSDSTIKFALSYADAIAGNAINFTTSGSLPMIMRRMPSDDDMRLAHESEYPPSYFFCEKSQNVGGSGLRVGSLRYISYTPLVRIDTRYFYFTGVQAAYNGALAVIILKDPIEVAA